MTGQGFERQGPHKTGSPRRQNRNHVVSCSDQQTGELDTFVSGNSPGDTKQNTFGCGHRPPQANQGLKVIVIVIIVVIQIVIVVEIIIVVVDQSGFTNDFIVLVFLVDRHVFI